MEAVALMAGVRVDLAPLATDLRTVEFPALACCFFPRRKVYLAGIALGAVTLLELGLLDRCRFLLDNVLRFRWLFGLRNNPYRDGLGRPQNGLGSPQDEVGDLDAFRLPTVRCEAVGGLRVLPSFHPPYHVTGQNSFCSLWCPDVSALLSSPEKEDVVSLDFNTLDEFPHKILRVWRFGRREGPLMADGEGLLLRYFLNSIFLWSSEDLLQEGLYAAKQLVHYTFHVLDETLRYQLTQM